MKILDVLQMLETQARAFRRDRDYYKRNAYMHSITEAPPQEVVDAVLAGFINYIGMQVGVDYGLYAEEL